MEIFLYMAWQNPHIQYVSIKITNLNSDKEPQKIYLCMSMHAQNILHEWKILQIRANYNKNSIKCKWCQAKLHYWQINSHI